MGGGGSGWHMYIYDIDTRTNDKFQCKFDVYSDLVKSILATPSQVRRQQ